MSKKLNEEEIGACKQRAAYLFGRFQSVVPHEKAKAAAIICVEEMKQSYDKINKDEEMLWEKRMMMFDETIKGIRAF